MIGDAFFSKATTTGAISTLIGTRLWPGFAPPAPQFPFGVYEVSAGDHEQHLGGSSGIAMATVEVTWVGATCASADAVAEAVRATFQGKRVTVGSLDILHASLEDSQRDAGELIEGSEKTVYAHTQQWRFGYRESVPA